MEGGDGKTKNLALMIANRVHNMVEVALPQRLEASCVLLTEVVVSMGEKQSNSSRSVNTVIHFKRDGQTIQSCDLCVRS